MKDLEAEIISALKKRFRDVRIFGSRARGDALSNSDVDLIVIDSRFENVPYTRRISLARQEISDILERTPLDVDIIPLTPEEFENLKKRKTNFIGVAYQRGEIVET